MEALELAVTLVGHLAWPLALLVVALKFAPTIREIGERATRLKVAGAEIELSRRLEEVRELADLSGLTVLLPSSGIARQPPQGTGRLSQPYPVPPPLPEPPGAGVPHAPPPPQPEPPSGRQADSGRSVARLAEVRGVGADARLTTWVFDPGTPLAGKAKRATESPALYLSDVWADLEAQIRSVYRGATDSDAFSWEEARAFLLRRGVLDEALGRLLDALRQTRNEVVHARKVVLTPAEAAEWGGIALTLSQRIDQRARMLGIIDGA